jgi:hypothetical protein
VALRTLDLGLDIVNGIRALDLESDGLARDCEFVNYRVLCGASQAMMAAQCVYGGGLRVLTKICILNAEPLF